MDHLRLMNGHDSTAADACFATVHFSLCADGDADLHFQSPGAGAAAAASMKRIPRARARERAERRGREVHCRTTKNPLCRSRRVGGVMDTFPSSSLSFSLSLSLSSLSIVLNWAFMTQGNARARARSSINLFRPPLRGV